MRLAELALEIRSDRTHEPHRGAVPSPGISNRQILEIFNAGRNKIKLIPGMRICHLVFQECRGAARYEGSWKDQEL